MQPSLKKIEKRAVDIAISVLIAFALAVLGVDEFLKFTGLTDVARVCIFFSLLTGLIVFIVMTLIYGRVVKGLQKELDLSDNKLANYEDSSREIHIAVALKERLGNRKQ